MRTEKQLIELYVDLAHHLESFNHDDVMPSFNVNRYGIHFYVYSCKNALDPWKTLIEFELKCGENLSIEDLVIFNILDCGFWKGYPIDESVFKINDNALSMAITDDVFLACCIAMHEIVIFNDMPYHSRWKNGLFIKKYVLSILEKIDKMKPMFFLELFTSNPSNFMHMVELSNSKELQDYILKLFTQNAALHIDSNVRKAYRKVVSQFKEEIMKRIAYCKDLQ